MKSVPSPSKSKSPLSRLPRRQRRLLIGVVLYTVIGFLILPAIIKWQLVKQLPKFTQRQAAVESVRMNPYALSLTIRGLALTETNGEPFAAFDEFYANFQLSSLFRWAWTFSEISLKHPTASIVREADGRFNFANLLTNRSDAPPAQTIPRVLVEHLVITNGVVSFADQTRVKPFRTAYGPIDVELTKFTTRREKDAPYSFEATTGDGESFSWSGMIEVNPPQSGGEFKLTGIPLAKYAPYAAEFTTAEILDGVVDVGAAYRIRVGAKAIALEVTNAAVHLRNLKVNTPGKDEAVMTITNLIVTNASASLGAREVHVPLIAIEGGSALGRRDADGKLNVLKLLVPRTNAPAIASVGETNGSPALPWKLAVDELAVSAFNVTVEDLTPPSPMTIGLEDLTLNVKGFSTESNAPVNVSLVFRQRDGGSAGVEAKGTLQPLAVEASVAATNLTLAPLQPYAEQFTHLVIQKGAVTSTGTVRYNPALPDGTLIRFDADVAVRDFKLSETLTRQELASWSAHEIHGVEVELGDKFLPKRVKIAEIKFSGLNAGVTITTNGQPNVLALLKQTAKPAGADAPTEPKPAAPLAEFPVEVGAFVLEKTSLHAVDQSLKPRFNTSVEEINGSVRDITWPKLGKSAIDFRGKVSALAPFEVTGALTPDLKQPFVDLKLAFKNSDLTPFSPYSEKFLGHPLNKGKLTFDLRYHIDHRALNASNVLSLDQLTLGPRNSSTNATKLPVRLAVALLKDRNGRIDLDLPVTGSLDDPKFSIGSVVLKVFVNLLVKVATSPFALLGAMFGGGEELQFVDFAPGSTMIMPAQTNKLEKLTKALFERPALNLEISASVDELADREALTRQKLTNAIRTMRIEELASRGKPTPTLAELQLEDADYDRLLRKAYKDAFNTTPEKALREARAAAAATNAASAPAANTTVRRAIEVTKGSEQLAARNAVKTAPTQTASTADGKAAAKPKTEDDLIRDELEQRFGATVKATDDDLRDLMQRRAQAVQKHLLDSGKVTAERLFLIAPKPVDAQSTNASRVIFSLN